MRFREYGLGTCRPFLSHYSYKEDRRIHCEPYMPRFESKFCKLCFVWLRKGPLMGPVNHGYTLSPRLRGSTYPMTRHWGFG